MIEHVTIYVKNLEEEISFYKKFIGLDIVFDMREKGPQIVFMAKKSDETKVELIEDAERAFAGSGISIGFQSDDVAKTREWFVSEGLPCTPVIKPNPVTEFFFVDTPAGFRVQIIN